MWILTLAGVLAVGSALAGQVDVTAVDVTAEGDGRFHFSVTLRHGDTGWDHYADRWEVVSLDGATVFGTRVLLHPHVHEQPFTRSLGGVAIPAAISAVIVRGHDKVHGFSGKTQQVALPGR